MHSLEVTDRELVLIMDALNDQASELKVRLDIEDWSKHRPEDYVTTKYAFREVRNLADRVEAVVNKAIDRGVVFSDT